MALPLPLRNRLTELILESLHDPKARSALGALVRFCGEPEDAPAPPDLVSEFAAALRKEHRRFREELCERTLRAWEVMRDRPLAGREPALAEALNQAADLFEARLFFEVHELLEPYWIRAEGQRLQGRDLNDFARAVGPARDAIVTLGKGASRGFDWGLVPRFPRGG